MEYLVSIGIGISLHYVPLIFPSRKFLINETDWFRFS